MRKKIIHLSPSSSMPDVLRFMLATYDGWFAISVSILYFIWGGLGAFGVIPGEPIDPYGLIGVAVALLVIYIWHRADSDSDDKVKSFWCLLGMIAIASIPFHKLVRSLL